MKIFIVVSLLFIYPLTAFATPERESDTIDAEPIVVYGKDSTGVIRPILVSSDGTVQTE